jgi:hypothetical protein
MSITRLKLWGVAGSLAGAVSPEYRVALPLSRQHVLVMSVLVVTWEHSAYFRLAALTDGTEAPLLTLQGSVLFGRQHRPSSADTISLRPPPECANAP